MKIILATGLALLAGCSTVGVDFSPVVAAGGGESVIYIYGGCDPASNEYVGGGFIGPKLKVNGDFVGYLADDSYIPLVLPIGSVDLGLVATWNNDFPKLEFTYHIKDSADRYLRFGTGGEQISYAVLRWDSFVHEVTPEVGQAEIKACQLNAAALKRAQALGYGQ